MAQLKNGVFLTVCYHTEQATSIKKESYRKTNRSPRPAAGPRSPLPRTASVMNQPPQQPRNCWSPFSSPGRKTTPSQRELGTGCPARPALVLGIFAGGGRGAGAPQPSCAQLTEPGAKRQHLEENQESLLLCFGCIQQTTPVQRRSPPCVQGSVWDIAFKKKNPTTPT